MSRGHIAWPAGRSRWHCRRIVVATLFLMAAVLSPGAAGPRGAQAGQWPGCVTPFLDNTLPVAMAVDEGRHRLVVADWRGNGVWVVDTTNGAVLRRVGAGVMPSAVAVDARRHRFWRESVPDRSDHDFFVGTARVLVHNANGPCPRPWSDIFKIAQKVVKGDLPLDVLTPEEREMAAEFYDRAAQNTVNKYKDYATRYNLERAKVLRGLRGPVPTTILKYIEALDSGQEH